MLQNGKLYDKNNKNRLSRRQSSRKRCPYGPTDPFVSSARHERGYG